MPTVISVAKYREEFQYNDCLGSSIANQYIATLHLCFNTTIVWVRHESDNLLPKAKQCFNTTIVWVRHSEFTSISPEPKFQYNDCLGSSNRTDYLPCAILQFQYNDCLGSSEGIGFLGKVGDMFQYNDCLGSSFWS